MTQTLVDINLIGDRQIAEYLDEACLIMQNAGLNKAGVFSNITTAGQLTSTIATGTAPLVVSSTTNVANLNASSLSGATFAAPGAIGGTTPATATFTTLTASSTTTLSSMTAGSVLYAGTSGVVSQDNANLFWDGTNHRLLVGGAAPTGGANSGATLFIGNAGSLNNWQGAPFLTTLPTGSGSWLEFAENTTNGTTFRISKDSNTGVLFNANNKTIGFRADAYGTAVSGAQMTLLASGNVGIGTTTPLSKLNVQADASNADATAGGQFIISGATDPTKRLGFEIDTTNNYALIQASKTGTSAYQLALNPSGGNVLIGASTFTSGGGVQLGSPTGGDKGAGSLNVAGGLYINGVSVAAASAPVFAQSTPSNPTGTSNTTGLMMGLAGAITPTTTGTIVIMICGDASNTTILDGCSMQIRYGTSTAPTNGAALTGTAVGGKVKSNTAVAAEFLPFSVHAIVTGLTLSTAYWIDLGVAAITGGTASVGDISISVYEL